MPIGTKISDLLEFAGGVTDDAAEIIMGGPMMGVDVCDRDAVIEKRNNAVTVMSEKIGEPETGPCIHCGRCAGVCPMRLYPSMVDAALNHGAADRLERLNVNYCMECGSCSFVCPAKRPLTQVMRLAKTELRRKSQ